MKILVINGPNLNFLGIREPNIYGSSTYDDLCKMIELHGKKEEIDIEIYQSNHEGDIIDRIQWAYYERIDGIVINPAGYTHTSVAIYDALKAVMIPYIEVHISDVSKREPFRQVSYVREGALDSVIGFGFEGYIIAIDKLKKYLVK